LKKFFPWKLAPKLSPNKTIVGGIGGLVGGMIGAIAAYYVYYFLGGVIGTELVYTSTMPAVVAFMLIGLITAIFAQLGDLFESAIKREYGIKDMGKLLPGHGGMLDRFDSLLFSSVIVLFSFGVILI
jgi:phosphatidate cytidylyltransferase